MSYLTDTGWQTGEVCLWLDNDQDLYETSKWMNDEAFTRPTLAAMLYGINWDRYNDSINPAWVDWDQVAQHVIDREGQ